MTSPSIVRLATPADSQEIWRLLLQDHRENGLFTLAVDKVQWVINRALYADQIPYGDMGMRGVIGVIGPQGALEGLVFVTITSPWYSHDKHIADCIVYVDPECRRTTHAHELVKWMKNQVEITGLPLISGIVTNVRTEAKCRLYRRMMPKIGEFFYLAPKNGNKTPALAAASSLSNKT